MFIECIEMLLNLLANHLFNEGLELAHALVKQAFNDVFLLQKIVQVLHRELLGFLLLARFLHCDCDDF